MPSEQDFLLATWDFRGEEVRIEEFWVLEVGFGDFGDGFSFLVFTSSYSQASEFFL